MTSISALERLEFLLEARTALDAQIKEARIEAGIKRRYRSRNVIPECGTETAYQRHRYNGEPADDACKKAHAAHNRKGD